MTERNSPTTEHTPSSVSDVMNMLVNRFRNDPGPDVNKTNWDLAGRMETTGTVSPNLSEEESVVGDTLEGHDWDF